MRKNMLTETIRTHATPLKDSLLQLRQSGLKKGVEITYIYYYGHTKLSSQELVDTQIFCFACGPGQFLTVPEKKILVVLRNGWRVVVNDSDSCGLRLTLGGSVAV